VAEFKDISALKNRANGLRDWLTENAPECFTEQKHLDEGTQERVYWHYGYMVALRDALRFMTGSDAMPCIQQPDTSGKKDAA
jgi:hypothetical protein